MRINCKRKHIKVVVEIGVMFVFLVNLLLLVSYTTAGPVSQCFNGKKNAIASISLRLFSKTAKGCVWIGHTNPDTDTFAGAIGAAALFNGVPASTGEVNSETLYVLKRFGFPIPKPITEFKGSGICLVDVNQATQLPPSVNTDDILGVVDHHALRGEAAVISEPVMLDILPVGSASTIIASYYSILGQNMTKNIAGLLFAAILSDTLNLKGPTTTEMDRLMVDCLRYQSGIIDTDKFAKELFAAKAAGWAKLTADQVVRKDTKKFEICGKTMVWGTVETTDTEAIIKRRAELFVSLQKLKEEDLAEGIFLSIVDIVNLKSSVLLIGADEKVWGQKAFKDGHIITKYTQGQHTILDIGNRVSRKHDFMPPLTEAVCNTLVN